MMQGSEMSADKNAHYMGKERRDDQRRTGADRRDMVRFCDKPERRTGKDRRNFQGVWNTRCTI